VIAGLDDNNKPFITAMDLLGALGHSDEFVVSGTNSEALFGVCESFYKPELVRYNLFHRNIFTFIYEACANNNFGHPPPKKIGT
jgi:20S proteasome alpha/beta subunit